MTGCLSKEGTDPRSSSTLGFFLLTCPVVHGWALYEKLLLLEREKASGVKMDTFSGAKQDIGVAKQTKEGFRKSQ